MTTQTIVITDCNDIDKWYWGEVGKEFQAELRYGNWMISTGNPNHPLMVAREDARVVAPAPADEAAAGEDAAMRAAIAVSKQINIATWQESSGVIKADEDVLADVIRAEIAPIVKRAEAALKSIPTKDLVAELRMREGVEASDILPEEQYEVAVMFTGSDIPQNGNYTGCYRRDRMHHSLHTGPAIILKVID